MLELARRYHESGDVDLKVDIDASRVPIDRDGRAVGPGYADRRLAVLFTVLAPAIFPLDHEDVQGRRNARRSVFGYVRVQLLATAKRCSGTGQAEPDQPLLTSTQFLNGLSPWWHSGQSGRHLTFQFAEPKIITEARWFQNVFTPHGTWKWQGSADGGTWSDLSTDFVLAAGPCGAAIGDLSANVDSYRHYRLVQIGGAASDNPFLREIEFRSRKG